MKKFLTTLNSPAAIFFATVSSMLLLFVFLQSQRQIVDSVSAEQGVNEVSLKENTVQKQNIAIEADILPVNTIDLRVNCFANAKTWTNSRTPRLDAPWSMMGISYINNVVNPNFVDYKTDINGDGLPDYVLVSNAQRNTSYNYKQYSYDEIRSCVMLNNGSGYDIVFKCWSEKEVDNGIHVRYYGDCAQL